MGRCPASPSGLRGVRECCNGSAIHGGARRCPDADGLRENVEDGITGIVVSRRERRAPTAGSARSAGERSGIASRDGCRGTRARPVATFTESTRSRPSAPSMSASSRYRWRMTARVDLVWLGVDAEPPAWPARRGVPRRSRRARDPRAHRSRALEPSPADAWLFWDSLLAPPRPDTCDRTARSHPGDIWHAGPALGLAGAPGIIDYISPDVDVQSRRRMSCWRRPAGASRSAPVWCARACCAGGRRGPTSTRSTPHRSNGGTAASRTAFFHATRRPCSAPPRTPRGVPITLADEFRFARALFDTRWRAWAAIRAAITGYARFEDIADAWLVARPEGTLQRRRPLRAAERPVLDAETCASRSSSRLSTATTICARFCNSLALRPCARSR